MKKDLIKKFRMKVTIEFEYHDPDLAPEELEEVLEKDFDRLINCIPLDCTVSVDMDSE